MFTVVAAAVAKKFPAIEDSAGAFNTYYQQHWSTFIIMLNVSQTDATFSTGSQLPSFEVSAKRVYNTKSASSERCFRAQFQVIEKSGG